MKFRLHRGSLADSLETTVELEPTAAAIAAYMSKQWPWDCFPEPLTAEDIAVEPYGYDDRIKTFVHVVWMRGRPFGFTDGPLQS